MEVISTIETHIGSVESSRRIIDCFVEHLSVAMDVVSLLWGLDRNSLLCAAFEFTFVEILKKEKKSLL